MCHLNCSRFFIEKKEFRIRSLQFINFNEIIMIYFKTELMEERKYIFEIDRKIKRQYYIKIRNKKKNSKNALVIFNNLFSWWVCGNCCSCLCLLPTLGTLLLSMLHPVLLLSFSNIVSPFSLVYTYYMCRCWTKHKNYRQ